MSEHKTGHSNWSAKQKQDYWDRRNKGLRGQRGVAIVVQTIRDKKGNIKEVIPVSDKVGPKGRLGLRSFRRADWREARAKDRRENRAAIRNQQKQISARGE